MYIRVPRPWELSESISTPEQAYLSRHSFNESDQAQCKKAQDGYP